MNNTIDFNTAKTIGTMSKKIDHIDDTVSGFFSFMHMVMQNELGNAEPYFAAVSPVLDLTVIRPDDAPHILPCFDEADEGIGISEDEPLGFRYNPKQVIKLMGKRYLVGPVIFHRFDDERNFASLTMSDMYTCLLYTSCLRTSSPAALASILCSSAPEASGPKSWAPLSPTATSSRVSPTTTACLCSR